MKHVMKETLIATAIGLANDEAKDGRTVMVLFPDMKWTSTAKRLRPAERVHVRATTVHTGLKSLLVDTLILVAPDASTWDQDGEAYARERSRASSDPRIVTVGGKP